MRVPQLEAAFPNLQGEGYLVTSEATPEYNCIAWAAGDMAHWWWPDEQYYWPAETRDDSLLSFVTVFQGLGYRVCEDEQLEPGFEKIAIYVDSLNRPQHMTRQLPSGEWSSKCGNLEDITHTLQGLVGEIYGEVAVVMKKPLSD